jgi:hypothetical protein
MDESARKPARSSMSFMLKNVIEKLFTGGKPSENVEPWGVVSLWDLIIDSSYPETNNTFMRNGLFTLNKSDFIKGLVTAVFSSVWGAVAAIVGSQAFDLFTLDWKKFISIVVASAIVGAAGYLNKNYVTDIDRHETVAGIIPTK